MVPIEQGVDQGLAWHYGDPLREQRWMEEGSGVVDLANREVFRVTGAERATYLNLLGTAKLDDLAPGQSSSTFLLDAQGHILFFAAFVDTGNEIWGWTEPGSGEALVGHLNRMKFRMDVDAQLCPDIGVVWRGSVVDGPYRIGTPNCLGGAEAFIPRADVESAMSAGRPVGLWAYTAVRIAAGIPRIGVDTDARTIPNELGVPSENLDLNKGCYPGQETVAKVYNMGAPPRRLVRLHFDGSEERFLDLGTPLKLDGDTVGYVGSMAYHHELGPIGLSLVKHETDDAATLFADSLPARIDPLVPKDVGLHVRFQSGGRTFRPIRPLWNDIMRTRCPMVGD